MIRKIFLFICIFFLQDLFSDSVKKRSSVVLYSGLFINSDFGPIILNGDIAYKNSYIAFGGYNYRMEPKIRSISFETETILGKHWGVMNHYEIAGMLIARSKRFNLIPITFAFGEGLSLANEAPILETKKRGYDRGVLNLVNIEETRPLLNFIMVEVDFKLPSEWFPKLFVRIHHRSGIWGTYCPPDPPCGSNFLTYGVKLSI